MFNYIFKKLWGKSESSPPKTEEIKTEEPKTEEPNTEEPKTEEIKTEEIKTEEIKTEEIKTEEIKTEEPKTEEPKTEEPNTEEIKTEEIKTEEIKTEEPKTEEIKTEEPKTEEPKTEEPKKEKALLNLFYNYNTDLDLNELLSNASDESMLYTLKIIAHIRKNKCNSTSEFHKKTCEWLSQNHEKQLIINMPFFLENCGQWNDLAHLPSDCDSFKEYIHLLSNNLKTDLDNINNGPNARSDCVTKSISSIANWIQHDRNILPYISKELGINMKTLKKDYLKPLTKNLSLEVNSTIEPLTYEKSERIVAFNLSHHEIMLSALSDPCYDDIKCNEQSLGTNV